VSALEAERVEAVVRSLDHDDSDLSLRELIPEHDKVLAVSVNARSGMLLCIGLARRADLPAFRLADRRQLQAVVPVASHLAALQAECMEFQRRELVFLALRHVTDACCVVDRENRRVAWMCELRRGSSCARDVQSFEGRFIDLVEEAYAASLAGDSIVAFPTVGHTSVVRVCDLSTPSVFGGPCHAVALVHSGPATIKLSARERQIAQMMVTGFTTVNAAAILGVSENTIRTYVRRLYRKLNVTNRTDLAARCSQAYVCGEFASHRRGEPFEHLGTDLLATS
jgi:DNA-binding CsgD family transcriptional regulator